MGLGVNAMALGRDRVVSTPAAAELNQSLRAMGLMVYDPDLCPFTMGGGGRTAWPSRWPGARRGFRRVIADLGELDRRTGGPGGARRVGWTDDWEAARVFLRDGWPSCRSRRARRRRQPVGHAAR